MPNLPTSMAYPRSTEDQVLRVDAQLTGQSLALAAAIAYLAKGDERVINLMQVSCNKNKAFEDLLPIDNRDKQEANSAFMKVFTDARSLLSKTP